MQQLVWKPEPRQADFIQIPDTVFEGLYGGAAAGGKSETLLMLPIARQFIQEPRFKGIIFRRTYPELEKEMIIRSHEYYPAAGGIYKDQKKRWQFPSGAVLQFGYAEHEKDVRSYDTTEYNYMAFDEVTSFTKFMYEYLAFSRCRSSNSNLPAIVRSGTNPGNIGHSYIRKRFIEPCPRGNTILREKRFVDGKEVEVYRIFIPSKYTDNSHIMREDPGYAARMDMLPEAERRAKKDGDWWVFEGQVFDEWRVAALSDEPLNAQHVVAPFNIPSYWPRVLAIDWGYTAMMCAGWYAINPLPNERYPAKIYKYRERTCTKTKIAVWAADLKRITGDEKLSDVVLDPSAWGNRGDEFTIAEQFSEAFGTAPRRADNDRLGGKELLQEYLRWKPLPPRATPKDNFDLDFANRIYRFKGETAYKAYCDAYECQTPEPFLPKLQVFDTCEQTINTIPLCVYDKNNKEDVQAFDGDDPYDETRYAMKACQLFLDGGKPETELAAKIARAEAFLEQTGNMFEFQMRMNKINSQTRPVGPIRRRHGRRF